MVVKIPTGIEPVDRVLGGLERGQCHYLFGSQAAGRGIAAVHFMIRGLQNKERVVFITRSSGPEVVERMSQMGYDYSTDVRTEQFIILEYTDDIVEQIQNLTDFDAVIRELEALLSQRKPSRLVFDPISYLFVSKAGGNSRSKIRKFCDWLSGFGPTTLIAGGEDDPDDVISALHDCCQTTLRVNRKTFGTQEVNELSFVRTSAAMQLSEEAFMIDPERGIVPVVMRPPAAAPPPVAEPIAAAPPPSIPAVQQVPVAAAQHAASVSQSFPWERPQQMPPPPLPPAAEIPPVVQESSSGTEARRDDRFKVLVIDDDPATCNLISMALKDDCSVDAVHDGPSGLNALKGESYDLVLLDVNLPIVDGFHVCQHIRKTHWQVPIIIITGTHLRAEDRLQSASVGGDLYLTKPFSVQELRLRVRQLIGRYREVPEWIGAGAGAGLDAIAAPPSDERMQQLVPYEEFIRRLEHERRNSKAVGMPFSVVGCRLQGDGSPESEERMRDLIRSQMRENDVMSVDRDQRFLVILPEASAEGAQIFIQRVRQMTMTEAGLDPVFQWRTYPTDGESFEQLLMRAPEARAVEPPSPRIEAAAAPPSPPQTSVATPAAVSEETTRSQEPPATAPISQQETAQIRETPEAPVQPAPAAPPVHLAAEPPRVQTRETLLPPQRQERADGDESLDLKSLVKEIFREELREFVRESVRESMRMGTQQQVTVGEIRQMLHSAVSGAQREIIPATKRQLPHPELSPASQIETEQAANVAAERVPAAVSDAPPSPLSTAPPAVAATPLETQKPAEPAPLAELPAPIAEPAARKPAPSDLRWSFIDFTQRR